MPKTTLLGDVQTPEPPTLGYRLKQWRRTKGLTQEALGKKLDVDVSTLRKYELGVNVPGSLFLAKALVNGLNVNWVLSGEGGMIRPLESGVIPDDAGDRLAELAHALAALYRTDQEKFFLLVGGFTARAQEATRLAQLERENRVKDKDTATIAAETEAAPPTESQAVVVLGELPTDSGFADLIKGRQPPEPQ